MQYNLKIYCRACEQHIGDLDEDTATMPEHLQDRINTLVLSHRPKCSYYREHTMAEIVYGD